MPVISTFCKKGGVGKSTFIGYLAHYYAQQQKNILVISVDDQNSIFKIFGTENAILEDDRNYFDYLIEGFIELGDVLINIRPNLDFIKTLNTDSLSIRITQERRLEKEIKEIIESYKTFYDYIFIDFPPASSRLSEVLIDLSDSVLIVVGLDSLGLGGFVNAIQYFVDKDLDIELINYILPNGFSKTKRAPKVSLEALKIQASKYTPNALVLPPLNDRSVIKNLQAEGISIFDNVGLSRYDTQSREIVKKELISLFEMLKFEKTL